MSHNPTSQKKAPKTLGPGQSVSSGGVTATNSTNYGPTPGNTAPRSDAHPAPGSGKQAGVVNPAADDGMVTGTGVYAAPRSSAPGDVGAVYPNGMGPVGTPNGIRFNNTAPHAPGSLPSRLAEGEAMFRQHAPDMYAAGQALGQRIRIGAEQVLGGITGPTQGNGAGGGLAGGPRVRR